MAPHLKTSRFHPNLSFHHQPFENNLNAISSKQTSPKTGSLAGVGRDKQTNQRWEAESQWNPEQFEESGNDINKVNARDRRPCFFAPHIFGTKSLEQKMFWRLFFGANEVLTHLRYFVWKKCSGLPLCCAFPPCAVLFPLCCAVLCCAVWQIPLPWSTDLLPPLLTVNTPHHQPPNWEFSHCLRLFCQTISMQRKKKDAQLQW